MPFEFIKKTMLTGIGVALKTQAEFEEITKSFIDKTRMSEEEGKKFVEEMMGKYQEAKVSMDSQIEKSVKKILQSADIASSKELNDLKEEVAKLKEELKK